MKLTLGIDLETSYFKLGLFDPAGELPELDRMAEQVPSGCDGLRDLPSANEYLGRDRPKVCVGSNLRKLQKNKRFLTKE